MNANMMHEEEKQLKNLYESIQYDSNLFKVYVGENRYIMGYRNSPNVPTLSNYAIGLRMPMRYVLKQLVDAG